MTALDPIEPVHKDHGYVFECVWPITGIGAHLKPNPDALRGLAALAMPELMKIAQTSGVVIHGNPVWSTVQTRFHPIAQAHPNPGKFLTLLARMDATPARKAEAA